MLTRFTLEPEKWYAMELIGDEFVGPNYLLRYSPIKVLALNLSGKGTRSFKLEFFHANYPAGVQNKIYRLRTIARSDHFMLAESLDNKPSRIIHLQRLSHQWLNSHFQARISSDREAIEWIERKCTRG